MGTTIMGTSLTFAPPPVIYNIDSQHIKPREGRAVLLWPRPFTWLHAINELQSYTPVALLLTAWIKQALPGSMVARSTRNVATASV